MTIEQKAAAYDEAIKRVENMKTGKCEITFVFTEGLFEYIFPELKESEDERIRKALLEMVHDTTGDSLWVDYNVHKEDAIAWLEKQGEQKPAENKGMNLVEEEMTPFQKKVFCIIDTTIEEEQGLKQVCDELLTLASNEIKQKPTTEIKSAEESLGIDSETYNKIVDECIYGEQKPAETEKGANGNEREIPFSEQKPADKGESFDEYEGLTDFERTLADICIGWIGQEPGWKQYIKDNANVLLKIAIKKFNSVQDTTFEQKPADWSENDEEQLGRALYMMEQLDMTKSWDDVYNWLKSIRPQNRWKPSEGQLEALQKECIAHSNYELCRLLEQLKKLKE